MSLNCLLLSGCILYSVYKNTRWKGKECSVEMFILRYFLCLVVYSVHIKTWGLIDHVIDWLVGVPCPGA